jgi:hypothetical protein
MRPEEQTDRRDLAAHAALTGLLLRKTHRDYKTLAKDAYKIAEEMEKAREYTQT